MARFLNSRDGLLIAFCLHKPTLIERAAMLLTLARMKHILTAIWRSHCHCRWCYCDYYSCYLFPFFQLICLNCLLCFSVVFAHFRICVTPSFIFVSYNTSAINWLCGIIMMIIMVKLEIIHLLPSIWQQHCLEYYQNCFMFPTCYLFDGHPPQLHLTTSKVMVIVWRLRGNIILTVLYWQRATSSVGTVNRNSSYSPVGPWVCLIVCF